MQPASRAIEIRILGHLEVLRNGQRLELGGPKQRALLMSLVIEPRTVVSVDRLANQLWAGRPPAGRDGTLHAYVSHLRRALEPDRAPGEPARVLLTRGSGYLLDIEPGQVDAGRFECLAKQGRRALVAGRLERADELLAASLALWRGQALADFVYEPFCEAIAARLEERRLEVTEDHFDAALGLGRHGSAVAELEQLTTVHRFRERLRGQLMLALYRSGRQADALRTYQTVRRLLRQELGTEPPPALRALEQAILRQAPALDWRPRGRSGAVTQPSSVARGRPPRPLVVNSTPAVLVGREPEMQVLEEALSDARGRCGGVVMLTGEPGAGKTRLAEELALRAARAGSDVRWGRCCEADGAPPFWPWAQIVRSLMDSLGGAVLDVAPLATSPTRLFEDISGLVAKLAARRPLVLILDDLQWADAGSLDVLRAWSSTPPAAPVLLVGCYRDTDSPPGDDRAETMRQLSSEPGAIRVVVEGLARHDIVRFMTTVLGRAPKPRLVDAIHDRTAGNPFFVAELTRLAGHHPAATDRAGGPALQVPQGVRDVVRYRRNRLPDGARQILEAAAVVGREFDRALVARVIGMGEERTAQLLEVILASRLIGRGRVGDGRYRFSAGVTREVVYDDLPALRRARLHHRTAEALSETDPATGGVHSVQIAEHFWEAARGGVGERAFESALRASDWACSQAAYEVAEQQLFRAGEVVHRLAPGPRRDQLELALQLRLSTLLSMRKGGGTAEVGRACHRAGELCRRVGDADEVLWSLIRLGAFHSARLQLVAAEHVGARLLKVAADTGDHRFHIAGELRLGVIAFHEGRVAEAKRHLAPVTAYSPSVYDKSLRHIFAEHPAVIGSGYQALTYWLEGDDGRATMLTKRALDRARRLGDPYTYGIGLFLAACVGALRGQAGGVRRRAGELQVLADERGFRLLAASARVFSGWAAAEQGEDGVPGLTEGLAAMMDTGCRMMQPFFLGLLARAHRRAGRLEEALATLAAALAEVDSAGERFDEAELYRLHGEVLAALSPHRRADAEVSVRRALSVARAQGAVALERRAVNSATRLTADAGVSGRRAGRRGLVDGVVESALCRAPAL